MTISNKIQMSYKKGRINPFLILIYSGLVLIFSCEKDKGIANTCGVKNPTTDLEWMLNDIKFIEQLQPEESQYISITMATYNSESVFFSIYCDPTIDAVFPVRNCSGAVIGYWGEIPQEELKNQQVIWRSANCICLN
jgi:hypothetical protein